MKAKITKSDGTVIELEGTVEEIQKCLPVQPLQCIPWGTGNPLIPWGTGTQPIPWEPDITYGTTKLVDEHLPAFTITGRSEADRAPTMATSGYVQVV